MKLSITVAAAAILTVLCACTMPVKEPGAIVATKAWSDKSQHRRELMIGKWLGESKTTDGELRLALVERRENGTHSITFRLYDGSSYEESVEVGLWGMSGGVYFTIMRGWMTGGRFEPSDSTRAYYYDAYEIVRLDGTTFEYRSMETGNRFANRRVGDDFQFSD